MKRLLLISVAFFFVPLPQNALALKNPAAAYCIALGYKYTVEETVLGETGYCILPDDQKVDAWQFLLGQIATSFNYCAIMGYKQKVVKAKTDADKCLKYLTDTCLVCIIDDGTEVEVIKLMGLVLEETTCGDGVCGIPENQKSCPVDCPSGSPDGYCDRQKDGKRDPDCAAGEDPDFRQ